MSDGPENRPPGELGPAEASGPQPGVGPTEPEPTEPEPTRRMRRKPVIAGLALLALLAVGLATLPWWGPAVNDILPWGNAPPGPDPALAQRIDRVETQLAALRQAAPSAGSSDRQLEPLQRRIAALENRPAGSSIDAAELQQWRQQVETRLTALDARAPGVRPEEVAALRQQIAGLAGALDKTAARLDALEKATAAQNAADLADAGALIAVLRLREALQSGRPFAAEYQALAALARNRPELAAAAAPLAEAARTGVATRLALAERLRAVADALAAAPQTAAAADDGDWGSAAAARLRGLVTIRRVDAKAAPASLLTEAQRLLAAGDLAGAARQVETLQGPQAETARPWLEMARSRLAVEAALQQVERLAAARLGAGGSGASGGDAAPGAGGR